MLPAISLQSHDEPIIPVVIQDREYPFMVDTGATYSCIGKEGSRIPLSTSSIKTIGFSGKSQIIPLTACSNAHCRQGHLRSFAVFSLHPSKFIGERHFVSLEG